MRNQQKTIFNSFFTSIKIKYLNKLFDDNCVLIENYLKKLSMLKTMTKLYWS